MFWKNVIFLKEKIAKKWYCSQFTHSLPILSRHYWVQVGFEQRLICLVHTFVAQNKLIGKNKIRFYPYAYPPYPYVLRINFWHWCSYKKSKHIISYKSISPAIRQRAELRSWPLVQLIFSFRSKRTITLLQIIKPPLCWNCFVFYAFNNLSETFNVRLMIAELILLPYIQFFVERFFFYAPYSYV